MTQTTTQIKLTFAEYLTYDDGTDHRYELEDRNLILINPPSFIHALSFRFLTKAFERESRRLN